MPTRSVLALIASLAVTSAAAAQAVHVPSHPFNGDLPGDEFGGSVSRAGDVNNDGFDDFIVGARLVDTNGFNSGSATIFSGATGQVLYTFNGDGANDLFGWSVSKAGDVNNDGFDDLIVGALNDDNNGSNSGIARVFSGIDGAILYTFNGDSPSDQFGWSVSTAGDVNNDGFDDLIVGTPFDDNNGSTSGSARVFSGATGAILYTFNGDAANDLFGYSVSAAGDVNNDGFDDFIVGGIGVSINGPFAGGARVFSGFDGAILYNFYGDADFHEFGGSVSSAGDVNNDGVVDFIVGAIGDGDDGNGVATGSARLISGADGSILYTFYGDSGGDVFGISVSGAGDVNSDGFDDVIVGARSDDKNGTDSGSARVFSGATGQVLYTFLGDSAGDNFGQSVSGAGDVNNDGVDDFIVGAWFDDNNLLNSGSARIFYSDVPFNWGNLPASCPGDADGNRTVNFADISTVLSNFGIICP